MAAAENKKNAHRLVVEGLNTGNMALIDEIIAPNAVEDELADGDKVMHRLMGKATMKGDFQGMKASGKTATWQEMHIGRFDASGKIVEHWGTADQLGMLTQLGFGPQGH